MVAGRVVLDAAAVKAAEVGGTKLEDAVRLGDLTAAGWKSTGWVRAKNGGAALTLTKGFARAEDAGAVVAELNGADGPLRGVRVTRSTSTFSSDWGFSGVADLKDLKTGLTGDQELVGRLTAERVDVGAWTSGCWWRRATRCACTSSPIFRTLRRASSRCAPGSRR